MLSGGLAQASLSGNNYFTVNNIIRDLDQNKALQNCFVKNLKIDNSSWSESDKSLLDIPISELVDRISFADKTIAELIKIEQDRLEKLQCEDEEE